LGADFHIGLPPSEFHRVANVVPPPAMPTMPGPDMPQLDPNSVAFKTWTNPAMSPETTWSEGWRRADIGAGNGHGNAYSVARLEWAGACGGFVAGVGLLSPRTIARIFEVQFAGIALVTGPPGRMGLGYALPPGGRLVFGGGTGGSVVIADVDRHI